MAAASLVRNASMLLARPSRPLAPVRASQTRVDASAANWAAKRRVALRSNGAAAVDSRRGLAGVRAPRRGLPHADNYKCGHAYAHHGACFNF